MKKCKTCAARQYDEEGYFCEYLNSRLPKETIPSPCTNQIK